MRYRRPETRPSAWENCLVQGMLALGNVSYDVDGRARTAGTLRIVQLAERLATFGHEKQLVNPHGILQYEIARWSGRPLPLVGQPPLRRGEPFLMLHFNNAELSQAFGGLSNERAVAWQGVRMLRAELRMLAGRSSSGHLPEGVRAIWAETLLYPALARFGFSTRPSPRSLRTALVRVYLLGLTMIYSEGKLTRSSTSQQYRMRLGEAWITLSQLKSRLPPIT